MKNIDCGKRPCRPGSRLRRLLTPLLLGLLSGAALAAEPVPVGFVLNVYNGDRAGPETDTDANAMAESGLEAVVAAHGGRVVAVQQPDLTDADRGAYGRWNRFGLVSGHFAQQVVANERAGIFSVGLYNNCSSALGMLGGLRHAPAEGTQRVGMVWIDAHGDYNVPETTLSGMLGGMPAAIATGGALHRLRQQAGLDEPLAHEELLMVAVRDTDPLEQERIEADGIARVSSEDVRSLSAHFDAAFAALARRVDVVYVHVDLDVLDPAEVPGHPLKVPDGPSSAELGRAIERMFAHEKTVALGIASYPHEADPEGVTREAVHRLVAGALRGIAGRRSALALH